VNPDAVNPEGTNPDITCTVPYTTTSLYLEVESPYIAGDTVVMVKSDPSDKDCTNTIPSDTAHITFVE
tara:strand:- start:13 stop:216 length:204 start_codon:yes stop_codon:yes gene_type:complete